ncbi:MAG TPA: hypothetical protein VNK70_02835 [Candidatus Paceibacterota bacterium]|nr:hypothetical protein [Candidatus Paceibacterota bacterium]
MESLAIILKLHTPEELVFYSNIAHWIEGGIFLIVALIALLQIFGYWKNKPYLWPSLILITGLFLPLFSFSHHLNELRLAWQATIYDPQQRQHIFMAILMSIAGFSELMRLKYKGSGWGFVLPTVLATIGVLFLTHPQHGTSVAVIQAMLFHKYLGKVFILSGVFRGAEIIWSNRKWLVYPWIIFLSIAALLLINYREPSGAYMPIDQHNMP